uniref:Protein MMS22-like n=1 Tax=Lygus hesperus TaxID=30085 RepID=A0A146L1E7_LYGHE
MDDLFKMARKDAMTLDSQLITNVLTAKSCGNSSSNSAFSMRRNCVDLYSFLDEYISCVAAVPKYSWCLGKLLRPLCEQMEKLQKQLGPLTSLSESVYLHASNARGNKCEQPSYHLFHMHLDLRWMQINVMLKVYKAWDSHQALCDSQVIESSSITKADISRKANSLMFELIDLAFLRFEKLFGSGCCKKSPFSCSCIQDLWVYLHRFYSSLFNDNEGTAFWSSFCGYIGKINGLHGEDFAIGNPHMYQEAPCSSKAVFSLWLLSNVTILHKSAGLVVSNNHALLENLIKLIVADESNEGDIKTCLVFIESLCIQLWEPKVEPIVCLWEYFHKKINNSFYVPGSSIDSIATLSKTSSGLLKHVRTLIESKRSCATTSYQHFIRIVGLHLQRTKNTPRHWNVIKGRVFSKMSGPRLGGLSQTGEHHVVVLFVMLAITVGIGQVDNKFIEIITTIKRAKDNLSSDLTQGLMAFIVLSLNEKQNVSKLVGVVVDHVNAISPLDGFDVLKRFTEEVQEIFTMDDSPGLGLHLLLDSWMSSYLTCCAPAESSRLLESVLVVVNRIKVRSCLNSPDQDTVLFVERLWEQLNPYFNGMSAHMPVQSAELAASLVVLFINTGNHDRASAIMNLFIVKDCSDVWISRRFITKLILNDNVVSILPRYNKIIIKAWIRCCIICTDAFSMEMKSFTSYISNIDEISCICNNGDSSLLDSKEPLLYLCNSFRSKFESTENIYQKQNLRERLTSYMDGIDRWLKSNTVSQDHEIVQNVFKASGNMVRLCANLLYTKSKPNTVLQQIIDTLLLPASVRNPEYKLSVAVTQSIKEHLHLFIEGLHSLYSNQDSYIMRIIKELITVYVPRCVTLPSPLPPTSSTRFALVAELASFSCNLRCLIFETVSNQFFKKKSKVPHLHACHALTFLKESLSLNDRNADVIKCFIRGCFERLCDMMMFCDDKSAALSHTKKIVKVLLNSDMLRENSDLIDSLTYSLAALCNEHLAWSSRQTFDLVISLSNDAPDLVVRFLPQLLDTIKHIERKRGVGYDKNLRFGLERVETNLRSIKADHHRQD